MPAGGMIDKEDPAAKKIAALADGLGITGSPTEAATSLGKVTLSDGKVVNAFVVHAVDAIITDGDIIVTIKRKNPPGQGLRALPGGLIDPKQSGGVETAITAAIRESSEEVNIDVSQAKATLVGTRNMNRPQDVRIARGDGLKHFGIHDGDVFMVSTQAVRFDVPGLAAIPLKAGDDADDVKHTKVSSLTKDAFGLADHYHMVVEAFTKDPASAPTDRRKIRNGLTR